jgi:hypothetical protein
VAAPEVAVATAQPNLTTKNGIAQHPPVAIEIFIAHIADEL